MTIEKRTRRYLTLAHLGGASSLVMILAWVLGWPDFVKGIGVGMLLIPLVVIPMRRMRDEYIDSLWRAGTAWAFVAVVICFLFAPFAEGLIDGLRGAQRHQDIPPGLAGFAAILAFFAGFHVKWLRG